MSVVRPKPWWKSKVIWINVALFLLAVLAAAGDTLPASNPALTYVPFASAVLNILLRFLTRAPIQSAKD